MKDPAQHYGLFIGRHRWIVRWPPLFISRWFLRLARNRDYPKAQAGRDGGTPVHIHIGDKSYETSASPSVAAALAREVRSRQMLRTGAKPSWGSVSQ